MAFASSDHFFHGLNPEHHFALNTDQYGLEDQDPRKRYRLSSATFKYQKVGNRWESSVDWEALMPLDKERERIRQKFFGYGIGRLGYSEISGIGAEVLPKPENDNEAHCALLVTERQARTLTKLCEIIDWPEGEIKVGN